MIHSYNNYCNFMKEMSDYIVLPPSHFSSEWMLKMGFVIVLIIRGFSQTLITCNRIGLVEQLNNILCRQSLMLWSPPGCLKRSTFSQERLAIKAFTCVARTMLFFCPVLLCISRWIYFRFHQKCTRSLSTELLAIQVAPVQRHAVLSHHFLCIFVNMKCEDETRNVSLSPDLLRKPVDICPAPKGTGTLTPLTDFTLQGLVLIYLH